MTEEKGLFPPFSGFPKLLFAPSGKGRKRQKKGGKGRFPGRAARHPPDLPFLGVLFFLGLFEPRKFLGVLSVFSCFSLFLQGFSRVKRR